MSRMRTTRNTIEREVNVAIEFTDMTFTDSHSPVDVIHLAADALLGRLLENDFLGDTLHHAHAFLQSNYPTPDEDGTDDNAFAITVAQVMGYLATYALSGSLHGLPG